MPPLAKSPAQIIRGSLIGPEVLASQSASEMIGTSTWRRSFEIDPPDEVVPQPFTVAMSPGPHSETLPGEPSPVGVIALGAVSRNSAMSFSNVAGT